MITLLNMKSEMKEHRSKLLIFYLQSAKKCKLQTECETNSCINDRFLHVVLSFTRVFFWFRWLWTLKIYCGRR